LLLLLLLLLISYLASACHDIADAT